MNENMQSTGQGAQCAAAAITHATTPAHPGHTAAQPLEIHDPLLTAHDVARRWGCSTDTVWRRQRQGLLKSIHFNSRCIRYRLSAVLETERAMEVKH